MAVEIYTAQAAAMDSALLAVECEITSGFAGLQLIGNVSEVCRNGVERAKVALGQMGIRLPQRRVLISIAPADLRKDGSQFDLAFAVCLGVLIMKEQVKLDPRKWMFVAELSLSGDLRPVKSVVSYALSAISAGLTGIVVSRKNLGDVQALEQFDIPSRVNFQILGFDRVEEVFSWLIAGTTLPTISKVVNAVSGEHTDCLPSFDDMNLSPELAKVAMVVCVGRHNVLLYGTPGTGKSMFAARLASIMPRMSQKEHMDALKISSFCNEKIPDGILAGRPPFRSPHHQTTPGAILGTPYRPGELSLAHGGFLFLDEFPEFRRDIVEALREPLETGEIQVSRAKEKVLWRARVSLIAATNNCPCGWFGSSFKKCQCSRAQVLAYKRKISGPILDRIDLHINTPERKAQKSELFVFDASPGPGHGHVLTERVAEGQEFSLARNRELGVHFNSELAAKHMVKASKLTDSAFNELIDTIAPKDMSNRALIRSLRVARTIADLELRHEISRGDLTHAINWQADVAARQRGDDCQGL
jgi:magnesium chelatase family protein